MKKIFLLLSFAIPGVLFAQQSVSDTGKQIVQSVIMTKDSVSSPAAPAVLLKTFDMEGKPVGQEMRLSISNQPSNSPARLIEILPADTVKKEK